MPLNYAKTALLLLALTSIFVSIGALIGGTNGLLMAFVVALVMNAVSLWKSDTMVLHLYGAHEVDENSAPEYYSLVQQLAASADLPPPRVYVIDNPQPNAFATGRSPSRSAVAASTGLLHALSQEELAGVIAHELAHIKNRDTLTMGVAATIGGAISMVAQYMQFGLFAGGARDNQNSHSHIGALFAILVAPFLAMLVQMAISRSREYQADRMGAIICRNPRWLSSALAKIHSAVQRVPNWQAEEAPATAHLFIINPLTGHGIDNLFSTHPNVENRIRALEELAVEMGQSSDEGRSNLDDISSRGRDDNGPWASKKARGPWG
ncbi:MAG: zinc metalloprotease HtpX [Hyphomicrobium sp.]